MGRRAQEELCRRNVGRAGSGTCCNVDFAGDGFDINNNYKALLQQQPYVKFFNSQRGYVRHLVTPARWQADFQVLDKVSVPDSRMTTRKRFVAENGKSGLADA